MKRLISLFSAIFLSILLNAQTGNQNLQDVISVSYTHLRAHETVLDLVCRLLLEKKTQQNKKKKQ